MRLYHKTLLCLAVMLAATGSTWAGPLVDDIGRCLGDYQDGTVVRLPGETIISVGASGKSFVIEEPGVGRTGGPPRLVVVSSTRLPVRDFWTVDVQGMLGTVATRTGATQRVLVVTAADVLVYCSPNGQACPFTPFKLSGVDWPHKRSLLELASAQGFSSVATFEGGELPPLPDEPDSEPSPPAEGSRDSLKWLPDGARVSVSNAIVSASFADFFYVERPDRSFGMWISSSEYTERGQLVDVTGTMATGGGERVVVPDTEGVTIVDTNTYPVPIEVGLPNKSLGGGAVGPFTPAVADSTGLSNTGLLVKTWGTVTEVSDQLFYLDDGSHVAADGENVGIKVYDPGWLYCPEVGQYLCVTGVSSAEIPEGSSSSIRTIWATPAVERTTSAGSSTISGTITAAGADGKTIRVYCANASTTATFSGDTASYSLSVPYGDHAVTAAVVGYKTTTQLATVNSSTPVTRDFTLPQIEKCVDIAVSPQRVPPDGISEMTVTATVRDIEGRRFPNTAITWNTDVPPEQIVSADQTTDPVGEARMVIRAGESASTATVVATAGGMSVRAYPEFAAVDAPTIHIVQPGMGDEVSGDVEVLLECWDAGGSQPGIATMSLLADGVEIGATPGTPADSVWHSVELPNGTHYLTATATDWDGNVTSSNIVPVATRNAIAGVTVEPQTAGAGTPVEITATLSTSSDWRVSVTDLDEQEVWSATGTGTAISAVWAGTTAGGLYTVSISSSDPAESVTEPVAVNPGDRAQVLLVSEERGFKRWKGLLEDIAKTAKRGSLSTLILLPDAATWERIQPALSDTLCQYFFISCHGHYHTGAPLQPVTRLYLTASKHILYAHNQWTYRDDEGNIQPAPPPGSPDPSKDGWRVAYAKQGLNRTGYPLRLAWIEACLSGHIGAERPRQGYAEDHYYWGKYGVYSCYETNGWNDMADALGIDAWAAAEARCAYVGYYEVAPDRDSYVGGGGPGMTPTVWNLLADGKTFAEVRDWIDDNPQGRYFKVPKPDTPALRYPGYYVAAPFYNWRFWGKKDVALF